MLVEELGRVKNEGKSAVIAPVDLKEFIPTVQQKGQIGIFWHLGGGMFVIYKCALLDEAMAVVEPGQTLAPIDLHIDYNAMHMDVWNNVVVQQHPELAKFSWDHFSRGRVLYMLKSKRFCMFAPPGVLNDNDARKFLAKCYCLENLGYALDTKIYRDKDDVKTIYGTLCEEYGAN